MEFEPDYSLVIPVVPGNLFMEDVNQHSAFVGSLLWDTAFWGKLLHNQPEVFATVPP
jgi:hypothetical protein